MVPFPKYLEKQNTDIYIIQLKLGGPSYVLYSMGPGYF
jgi:hypothetical protein